MNEQALGPICKVQLQSSSICLPTLPSTETTWILGEMLAVTFHIFSGIAPFHESSI